MTDDNPVRRYTVTIEGFGRVSTDHVDAHSADEAREIGLQQAGITVKVSTYPAVTA